jgi:hypothetical protein
MRHHTTDERCRPSLIREESSQESSDQRGPRFTDNGKTARKLTECLGKRTWNLRALLLRCIGRLPWGVLSKKQAWQVLYLVKKLEKTTMLLIHRTIESLQEELESPRSHAIQILFCQKLLCWSRLKKENRIIARNQAIE